MRSDDTFIDVDEGVWEINAGDVNQRNRQIPKDHQNQQGIAVADVMRLVPGGEGTSAPRRAFPGLYR